LIEAAVIFGRKASYADSGLYVVIAFAMFIVANEKCSFEAVACTEPRSDSGCAVVIDKFFRARR
jgi:hypothetical protein